MLSSYGKVGVNSASLRNDNSCLVSRANEWLCKSVDSFVVYVEQLLLILLVFYFHCCFGFVSLASVLVVFSQWVNSSHHVAQSLPLQEIETRDTLVSCRCVVFFLY